MGGGFERQLPEEALRQLQPGDVLFVQTLDSFTAWAVMYLTKSEVSHVALYLGDKRIVHSVPRSGAVIEPIEAIYSQAHRIVPCLRKIAAEDRALVESRAREMLGCPYGWLVVATKAANIVSGRDCPYFRLSFLIDAAIIIVLLDVPFWIVFRHPVVSWVWFAYAGLALSCAILWRFIPLKFFSTFTEKPGEYLDLLADEGATFLVEKRSLSALSQNAGPQT